MILWNYDFYLLKFVSILIHKNLTTKLKSYKGSIKLILRNWWKSIEISEGVESLKTRCGSWSKIEILKYIYFKKKPSNFGVWATTRMFWSISSPSFPLIGLSNLCNEALFYYSRWQQITTWPIWTMMRKLFTRKDCHRKIIKNIYTNSTIVYDLIR